MRSYRVEVVTLDGNLFWTRGDGGWVGSKWQPMGRIIDNFKPTQIITLLLTTRYLQYLSSKVLSLKSGGKRPKKSPTKVLKKLAKHLMNKFRLRNRTRMFGDVGHMIIIA